MISTHEFNTSWIGEPVGIIDDDSFFEQPMPVKKTQLNKYSWVVYKLKKRDIYTAMKLRELDFFYADTAQHFFCNISDFKNAELSPNITTVTGKLADIKFKRCEIRPFISERFHLLPCINQEKIDDRYFMWMTSLLKRYPELSIEVRKNNVPQGWFFSEPTEPLNILLGVLNKSATINGYNFYLDVIKAYAKTGVHKATGSFSIRHKRSHNIYSQIGVTFNETEDIYFYVNPAMKQKNFL